MTYEVINYNRKGNMVRTKVQVLGKNTYLSRRIGNKKYTLKYTHYMNTKALGERTSMSDLYFRRAYSEQTKRVTQ